MSSIPVKSAELFPRTRWSLVLQVQGDDTRAIQEALGVLLQLYWSPLYAYARRSGLGREDAEDAVQGYCEDLIRLDSLKSVRQGLGRLRSFLLAGFKNHLADTARRKNREKRGGKVITVSCDTVERELEAEMASGDTPAQAFDRRWAYTLLDLVWKTLRAEYTERGREAVFTELEPALAWNGRGLNQAAAAEKLGISEPAVHQQVRRMRLRFRELLDAEILHTVETPEGAEEERRHLIETLSG